MEVILHQCLAQVKNAHAKANRLVVDQLHLLHVDGDKVLVKDGRALIIWFRSKLYDLLLIGHQSDVNMVLNIFHGFPNTLWFISLKKSFSKSFVAFVLRQTPI